MLRVENRSLGNSRIVFSNQTSIHPNLEKVLRRHLEKPFQKNVLDFNQNAFDFALKAWQAFDESAPLILDSVCGTGQSTVFLAKENPQSFVLGVEKSQNRLNRQNMFKENPPENCAFVRADVLDFWRLLARFLAENHQKLQRHFLLYPNPYPKAQHLQRRFHGNAVFPFLAQLGGGFECRTNWQIYADEMAFACAFLTQKHVSAESFFAENPISAFEQKYAKSAHQLWRVVCYF